jgi:hypothetical protein
MIADKIIRRFQDLQGRRSPWEGEWDMCSRYVLPRLGKHHNRSNRSIFDSTAPLALGRFGAAMESFLVPRSYRWHKLVTGNAELDMVPAVARYLEMVTDILFAARYAPEANFANQILEAFLSLGVNGTAVIFVDETPGGGPRYQNIPIHEVHLAENSFGVVDTVYREYKLTARQAVQEFGDDLPDRIKADAEDPARQETKYHFIHAVYPRADYKKGRRDAKNMPVASVHVECSTREVVRESGYRVMPYAVSRFAVAPGEVYGRSPALDVLPDIIQLNEMKKTILRAAQKMVDPPLLLADDDILRGFNIKSGALNPGALNEQGQAMVVPLQIDGKIPIGIELMDQAKQVINDAFYISLFQILVEKPSQQTATEVMQRAQEKAQLLAPAMGRQQSELLRPIIERELDILIETGVIPEAPPEMSQEGRAEVFPKYDTTMTQALDSQDGMAIMQAVEAIGMLAQIDPGIIDLVKTIEAGKEVWRSFGASPKVLRSDEEVQAIQQAKAQQMQEQRQMEQAMALVQGAGGAGKAVKDFAQAGQIMEGSNGGAQSA